MGGRERRLVDASVGVKVCVKVREGQSVNKSASGVEVVWGGGLLWVRTLLKIEDSQLPFMCACICCVAERVFAPLFCLASRLRWDAGMREWLTVGCEQADRE